jgi:Zn-dependent protease
MFSQFEIGKIAGIPIILDMMFVLILILFSYPYFTSGDPQLMSAGLVIVAGIMLSILLHELGHAFAGRLFGVNVSHIELTALGGIAHFGRSLPASVLAHTVVYLAGPAANLALWYGFDALAMQGVGAEKPMLGLALTVLASANFYLMAFNLMPAYPLDGGHTLDAWLGAVLSRGWPAKIVATAGLIIAACLAISALPANFWRLLLAFFLFQVNWEILQRSGGWRR